jgi:hypothetical protein
VRRVPADPHEVLKKLMTIRRFAAVFAILSLGLFGAIILAQGKIPSEDVPDHQHTRFDARDREIAGEWYRTHQVDRPAGFREGDRLTPVLESNLRVGEELDPDLRGRLQPAPADLIRRFPPPPTDDQYAALDGHLLLLNEKTWIVSDVLHFELDFGRP